MIVQDYPFIDIVTSEVIEIVPFDPQGYRSPEALIESAARICYRSEEKASDCTAEKFISRRMKEGHNTILEFGDIFVKLRVSKALAAEIRTHRHASHLQESTRFCNYSKDKFSKRVSVIVPFCISEDVMKEYLESYNSSAEKYFRLLELGEKPQYARDVLPLSVSVTLAIKTNFRDWRNLLSLRLSRKAHPEFQAIALTLWSSFSKMYPAIFNKIEIKN